MAFRQRRDGSFNIAAGGALDHDVTLDSLRQVRFFLPSFWKNKAMFRFHVGRPLGRSLRAALPGSAARRQPLVWDRGIEPVPNPDKVVRSLAELRRVLPALRPLGIARSWAGYIDATPDLLPVLGEVAGAARLRARHRVQRPRLRDGAGRGPPRLRADRRRQGLARHDRVPLLALRRRRHRPAAQRPVTARAAGYAIALDVGGTFTDVALVHEASGRLWVTKTPTTPDDPSTGFIAGVDKALRLAGVGPEGLRHVLHGTTTATNAILENKGAPTGLLTTAGFRDVLEIGRHDIPRRANMFAWVKPLRPVPPERIFEIGGRVAVDGSELEALDEAAVRAAARRLREAGVDSVAVCFLHGYANATHERRARALVLAEHPGCAVSLSSEVLPVFREFERSMGTVLNAYVQPLVGRYVGRLAERLRGRGVTAPLSIMKSNGGVIGADVVQTQAIHTALSGPAAGVIGARRIGEAAGFADLISVDVGGTSADVCLDPRGRGRGDRRGPHRQLAAARADDRYPHDRRRRRLDRAGHRDGTLTVGPESAGPRPGPCATAPAARSRP